MRSVWAGLPSTCIEARRCWMQDAVSLRAADCVVRVWVQPDGSIEIERVIVPPRLGVVLEAGDVALLHVGRAGEQDLAQARLGDRAERDLGDRVDVDRLEALLERDGESADDRARAGQLEGQRLLRAEDAELDGAARRAAAAGPPRPTSTR